MHAFLSGLYLSLAFMTAVSGASARAAVEEGFFGIEAGPERGFSRATLQHAMYATVRIHDRVNAGSAVVLSPDGYVLTALHNVIAAPELAPYFVTDEPDFSLGERWDLSQKNVVAFDKQVKRRLKLPRQPVVIAVDIPELGAVQAEVLLVGEYEKTLNITVFGSGEDGIANAIIGRDSVEYPQDFAILKIISLAHELPLLNCVTLATETPKQGTAVSAIGLPARTHRRQGSAFGDTKHVSFGKITSSKSTCIHDNNGQPIGDDDFCLQTDVDLQPGNSGGMLLDTSGKVVGLNMAVKANEDHVTSNDYPQWTLSARSTTILETARKRLPRSVFRKVFQSCPEVTAPKEHLSIAHNHTLDIDQTFELTELLTRRFEFPDPVPLVSAPFLEQAPQFPEMLRTKLNTDLGSHFHKHLTDGNGAELVQLNGIDPHLRTTYLRSLMSRAATDLLLCSINDTMEMPLENQQVVVFSDHVRGGFTEVTTGLDIFSEDSIQKILETTQNWRGDFFRSIPEDKLAEIVRKLSHEAQ